MQLAGGLRQLGASAKSKYPAINSQPVACGGMSVALSLAAASCMRCRRVAARKEIWRLA